MNLSRFLGNVDTISKTKDQKQLMEFIHDIARVLPEENRADFLTRMKNCTGSLEKGQKHQKEDRKKYEDIKKKLEKIESWEMCLSGELNEEYDDWYHSDEDEFIFEDPEGIGRIIEAACKFVHESIDRQLYEEGNSVAELLLCLKIMVGGEYQDYTGEPLEIADLERYGLANIHYKNLVVEALYLAYCVNSLEERAEALYITIQNAAVKDITLEMIMQCGEELPELDEFLPKWIDYLGKQTSYIAEKLMDEALELYNDADNLLSSARVYYELHPGLYEKYIKMNRNNIANEDLILIGKEALEKINPKYQMRGRIAVLIAELELQITGKVTEEVEKCWFEAFRSDTRVVNYLRMMMECQNFSKWREKLQETNHKLLDYTSSENVYGHRDSPDLQENIPGENDSYLIALLNGEYEFVKEKGMNCKGAVGWSASYMKKGLAAFLLILLKGEILSDGTNAMVSKMISSVDFSAIEYNQGILNHIEDTDKELLWRCFVQAKSWNSMSDSEQEKWLEWIKKLVRKRVDGIMEGNHRNYYHECAEYIAALGEVIESRGTVHGKQDLMLEYKQLYSRRRAFHEELRNMGMRDKKK